MASTVSRAVIPLETSGYSLRPAIDSRIPSDAEGGALRPRLSRAALRSQEERAFLRESQRDSEHRRDPRKLRGEARVARRWIPTWFVPLSLMDVNQTVPHDSLKSLSMGSYMHGIDGRN